MKIFNKKNCFILSGLLSLTLICNFIFIQFTSKANNDYVQVSRDTSVSVDENGNLNITRTKRDKETPMGPEDTWTIFVYMTGSNLETDYECASHDIKEMLDANFTKDNIDKVNVIIQTGGAKKWHSNRITSNFIERLKVDTNSVSLTNLARIPNSSMGDANTLYDFLNWGIENYPAEHMGVVLWDHGSGVERGLCFDENYNDDSLSVHELEYTLAKLSKKMTSKFELIGFDTCLSGSLEYTNILAPYANYMVASADVAIAKGWYYTEIINYLLENPDATGDKLGPVICNATTSFLDNYFNSKKTIGYYTYATYDLSKVDEACKKTNELAKYLYELLTTAPNAYQELSSFRNNSLYYQHNCVDMGSIIHYFENSTNYQYDISGLKNALNDLIIHCNYKNKFDNKNCGIGISLYMPTNTYTLYELNTYRNVCFSPYLLKYFDYMNTRTMTEDMSKFITIPWESNPYFFESNFDFINYDIPYSEDKNINEQGRDILLTNPNYAKDGFVNSWYNNVTYSNETNSRSIDTDDIVQVSQTYNSLYTTLNNSLVCIGKDTNTNSEELSAELVNNTWFTLPDGQLLTAYVIASDNTTTIYSFPVLINKKECSIRVEKNVNANGDATFTTLGIWDANENPYNKSYIARGYLPIKNKTKIKPIYDAYDTRTQTYSTIYGKEYTINSDFNFTFTELDKTMTAYGYEHQITNGLYNVYYNKY